MVRNNTFRQPDTEVWCTRRGFRGVGVEQAVFLVVGMKRHTQQSAFIKGARTTHTQRYQQAAEVRENAFVACRQVNNPENPILVGYK